MTMATCVCSIKKAESAWRSSYLTRLRAGRFLINRHFILGLCIYAVAFNCLLDIFNKVARCDIVLDTLQDFLIDMPRIWSCFVTALPHVGPWFMLCIPTALNNLTVVLSSIFIWECHCCTCNFAWSQLAKDIIRLLACDHWPLCCRHHIVCTNFDMVWWAANAMIALAIPTKAPWSVSMLGCDYHPSC